MHYAQLFYSSVFIDYSYILINVCIKERVTHQLSHTTYVSGRNEEYVTAYAWLLVGSCPCSCSSCSNASVIIVSVMAGTYQNSDFTFNLWYIGPHIWHNWKTGGIPAHVNRPMNKPYKNFTIAKMSGIQIAKAKAVTHNSHSFKVLLHL